jgi:hypothetical protein
MSGFECLADLIINDDGVSACDAGYGCFLCNADIVAYTPVETNSQPLPNTVRHRPICLNPRKVAEHRHLVSFRRTDSSVLIQRS